MAVDDTTNTMAWVAECRQRNSNSIRNTSTGAWLAVALTIIERQFNEIQDMRNDEIDRATEEYLQRTGG